MDDAVALHAFRSQLLADSRYADARKLARYGYKVYSQNDEDGIIAEIFKRIGEVDRTFVEFGVGSGLECNSLWLLLQGWSGLWIESKQAACEKIGTSHANFIASGSLVLQNASVTVENINKLIAIRFHEVEIDLLSIDIDFNDYWIWKAIDTVRPRVVAIEYNACWAPPVALTVPYDPSAKWAGGNYFGASLSALAKLASQKGYDLVGCCLSGVNAFFVRQDLVKDKFLSPGCVDEHYEPARYFLASLPSGHRPAIGPVVSVS